MKVGDRFEQLLGVFCVWSFGWHLHKKKIAKPTIGIMEVECNCSCGWHGVTGDCEPDVDGDGSLGCPECFKVVEINYGSRIKRRVEFWYEPKN